jgi:hypothetical protein
MENVATHSLGRNNPVRWHEAKNNYYTFFPKGKVEDTFYSFQVISSLDFLGESIFKLKKRNKHGKGGI